MVFLTYASKVYHFLHFCNGPSSGYNLYEETSPSDDNTGETNEKCRGLAENDFETTILHDWGKAKYAPQSFSGEIPRGAWEKLSQCASHIPTYWNQESKQLICRPGKVDLI